MSADEDYPKTDHSIWETWRHMCTHESSRVDDLFNKLFNEHTWLDPDLRCISPGNIGRMVTIYDTMIDYDWDSISSTMNWRKILSSFPSSPTPEVWEALPFIAAQHTAFMVDIGSWKLKPYVYPTNPKEWWTSVCLEWIGSVGTWIEGKAAYDGEKWRLSLKGGLLTEHKQTAKFFGKLAMGDSLEPFSSVEIEITMDEDLACLLWTWDVEMNGDIYKWKGVQPLIGDTVVCGRRDCMFEIEKNGNGEDGMFAFWPMRRVMLPNP